ncbi:presenilin-2 isoform X1 [Tasmannia lanceolata]|uniref:presenilin-2 isoform X1 n=1 Tax=Tasmannia lanceolata TaxID=3420 RepID=UPI004062B2FE
MDQGQEPTSILEFLGEEIIRIIVPVSTCMFLVVVLVTTLNASSSSSSSLTTIATIAYDENTSDSDWSKFTGALLNSLVFVAIITVVTFLLVFLFYIRCTKFLKYYMGFSTFIVLGFMGGEIFLFLIKDFSIPIDCITFLVLLFNFTVVGVISVFMSKMAILITQGYLVVIGMLVAYWFTLLPEWTTWVLLVAMALYDLAAVLLPGGPLRLLVELAMSRDEEIPALVYEARPVTYQGLGSNSTPGPVRNVERRLWKEKRDLGSISGSDSNLNFGNLLTTDERRDETRLVIAEEGQISAGSVSNSSVSELSAPLIARGLEIPSEGQEESTLSSRQVEGIGLGSSGAIKLGLGDFIFYSVLVGRAAMYDFMTVYACYLAIIAGLGITLMLLAVYQKALPALPVSILLGTMFYVLTRFLLEAFVFQCSINLLMF